MDPKRMEWPDDGKVRFFHIGGQRQTGPGAVGSCGLRVSRHLVAGIMRLQTLEQEQKLPISREAAWEFFSTPRNLDQMTPPEISFEILSQAGERLHDGQIIHYRMKVLPGIRVRWITEIKSVDEGKSFVDEQRFGPYKFWHHRHIFEDIPGGVLMRDLVHYGLGFGPFGAIAHAVFVRAKLESIFRFRKEILAKRFGEL
jgi:ligand-binding SRPBCC domain-containing protein